MRSDIVTVWDGLDFIQVSRKDAEKLVKEDKAEIVATQSLRFRETFTGYHSKPKRQTMKTKTVEK